MAKKRRRKHPRALEVRVTTHSDSTLALEVDGVVQSISLPAPESVSGSPEPEPGQSGRYWELMITSQCPRHALLLGLGGGTVAHLLARRCPESEITGIEHDPQVLEIAWSHFGLGSLPQLRIVEADAFAWVAEQSEQDETARPSFDLICLDLFQAGRLANGALSKLFLRQVAGLLSPDGWLTVNLMVTARTPDQLQRLERFFVIAWQKRVRGNLVVHGHLPASAPGDAIVADPHSAT